MIALKRASPRHRARLRVLGVCLALALGSAVLAQSGSSYSLHWNVVSSGGATTSGTTYRVDYTFGQPSTVGTSTGTTYSVRQGYWAAAWATRFAWRSYDADGTPAFGVYDTDNATPLQAGDPLHLIWVGPDGTPDPPQGDGSPGDDDVLLDFGTIDGGVTGGLQGHGYFDVVWTYGADIWADGRQVYARAFNDPGDGVSAYGDSSVVSLAAGGAQNWPRWHTDHGYTLVVLESLTARPWPGGILVAWETASEPDVAGFHVWRSESEAGDYARANAELVPAQGSPLAGARYRFEDTGLAGGTLYFYKLEVVDGSGRGTLYGPVWAAAGDRFTGYLPLVGR